MLVCNGVAQSGLFEVIGEVTIEGDCANRTTSHQFLMATLPTSESVEKFCETHDSVCKVKGPAAYVARHKKLAEIKRKRVVDVVDSSIPF